MIKPESLWCLLQDCTDSKWLGDICRALGGQEVELDFGQQQALKIIRRDSELMDERMEVQREKERERKRNLRLSRDVPGTTRDNTMSRGQTNVPQCPGDNTGHRNVPRTTRDTVVPRRQTGVPQCPGDNTGVPGTNRCPAPSIHPAIPPSLPPTNQPSNSVCANAHAHTREDLPVDKAVEGEVRDPTVPSLKEVVAIATTAMNIPETYARWWYNKMQAVGWRTTSGLAINHANWRPMLAAWHNKAGEKELAEAQAQARQAAKPAPRVFTAKDWAPCHACAEFVGGQCQRGYTIPPELRKHPIPVEQCNYYERKEA